MAQQELNVRILSPERVLYKGPAKSLGLPGALGYMTILPGHAAMVAQLDTGVLVLEIDGKPSENMFLKGGFVDIGQEQVNVLVDVAEKPQEIDVERAKKALSRAEERLKPAKELAEVDVPRALASKKRAAQRLQIAGAVKALH